MKPFDKSMQKAEDESAMQQPDDLKQSEVTDDSDRAAAYSGFNEDIEEEIEIEALTHLENERLFKDYDAAIEQNDTELVNKIKWKIVVANTPLIYRITWPLFRKFKCDEKGFEIGDLVSAGYEGVRRAIITFNAEKEFAFGTYAGWWIRNYVVRYIHDNDRTMRLPQYLHEKIPKIRLAEDYFLTRGKGRASDREIANRLGWDEKEVGKIRGLIRTSFSSLDTTKGDGDDYDPYNFFPDDTPDPEKALIADTKNKLLRSMLDRQPKKEGGLKEAERCILKLRFGIESENEKIIVKLHDAQKGKIFKEIRIDYDGHEKKLEEIGDVFGVTRERIRQIEVNALRKLRKLYYHRVIKEADPSQITVEELSIIRMMRKNPDERKSKKRSRGD